MLRNIIALCEAHGLSLSELERRAGIRQRSIYRWDVNVPAVDKVKKVADYFCVSIEELLSEDDADGGSGMRERRGAG